MSKNQYSGIEFLTAIKNGEIAEATMNQTIPMRLLEVSAGKIRYELTPNEHHFNIQGGVHGGFCASVLDTLTGNAGRTSIAQGEKIVTIDLHIKMIRPLQALKTYTGEGYIINAGRTIVISEGKIFDENNKIFAHATATLMVIRAA